MKSGRAGARSIDVFTWIFSGKTLALARMHFRKARFE
jgi:hypothetical protein